MSCKVHERYFERNHDLSESEDFELNVKPFINPTEIIIEDRRNFGREFAYALIEDDIVLLGWKLIPQHK